MGRRDPSVTSKIMAAVRGDNTTPENALGSALWAAGFRYKKQYGRIAGRPDFALVSPRVAIFVDGDFWHGNGWRVRGFQRFEDQFKTRKAFWTKKISGNIQRDRKVNRTLRRHGWTVIRFWESEILRDPSGCVVKVIDRLAQRNNKRLYRTA